MIFKEERVGGRARVTTDEDGVLRGVWREIKSYRWRLRGIEKFEGEMENFMLSALELYPPTGSVVHEMVV